MTEIISAGGRGNVATFDGHFVSIKRSLRGEKRIPLEGIAAVHWKPAGALSGGFIQFTVPGGIERQSRLGYQTSDAMKDENSIVFNRKQQPAFEALRDAVEAAVVARAMPQAAQPAPDLADQLGRLADLRDRGVLTDAEFAEQKAKLLA